VDWGVDWEQLEGVERHTYLLLSVTLLRRSDYSSYVTFNQSSSHQQNNAHLYYI